MPNLLFFHIIYSMPGCLAVFQGIIPRHHLICHSLLCCLDKDWGISLFQSVPKHFLLLFYAWLSVNSLRGMLSTTSYVTTCQNWRSSNSRRHPPVQSTSEEHLSSRPVNQNRQIGSAQPIGTSNEVVPPPSQNIHGFGWSLQ